MTVSLHHCVIVVCAVHFDAGSVYHYSYITDLSLNEANEQNYNGAHRPVGFRVSADLKLTVVWKKSYDYLLRLDVSYGCIFIQVLGSLCM